MVLTGGVEIIIVNSEIIMKNLKMIKEKKMTKQKNKKIVYLFKKLNFVYNYIYICSSIQKEDACNVYI
jgi:hypothetical protein